MATREEILKTLNSLQIDNFKAIIEIATAQIVERRVQLERLQSFTISKKNRIKSLVNAVAGELAKSAVMDEYATFQTTYGDISGQDSNLDDIIGTIHYTVYGDVKRTKLRQRELSELSFLQAQIGTFADDLKTLEDDLSTLSSDLDAAAAV